jgi:BlaI family penicillinase repressor
MHLGSDGRKDFLTTIFSTDYIYSRCLQKSLTQNLKESMKPMKPSIPPAKPFATLSALELELMDIIWRLGDCTSAQVTAEFSKKRPLAPTTIRTVLTKLRSKGYVEIIPSLERGFMFRPAVPRETVARRSLKRLLQSLFQGSPRQAIAYLLEEVDISDSELREIRRMLDAPRQKGRGK